MTRLSTLVAAGAAVAALGLAGCGSKSSGTGGGGGSGGQFGVDFCTATQTVNVSVASLSRTATNPTTLPEAKSAVQIATASIDNMDDAAPSDISSDTHTLRTTLDSANAKVQAANDLITVQSALSALAGSDYTRAAGKVVAYVQSHCGFALNLGASPSGGGGSSGSTSATSTSS